MGRACLLKPKSEYSRPQKTSVNSTKPTSDVMEDPFVVLESTSTPETSSPGMFTDPLEEIGKLGNSGNTKVSGSSVSGAVFDDIDPLDGFGKSAPAFSSEINNKVKDGSPSRSGSSMGRAQTSAATEPMGRSSFRNSESHSKKMTTDNFQEPHQTFFDMPSFPTDSHKSVGRTTSPSYVNANSGEINSQVDVSPGSEKHAEPSDDVWLTVSEIPLSTQPTSAPPPSRPPPPIPARASKSEAGFFTSNARKKGNGLSRPPVKITTVSQIDELEDFAMGRTKNNVHEYTDIHSGEDVNTNSSAAAASAAAMKEAMDRAEAKFRHAKEVREREHAKTARSKEAVQLENDEQSMQDDQEKEYQENQERLDRERRQREEEERERRRLERERERARENERERERERARQAVERATREARERAAAEARERAAAELRLKAERAAAEARERAEKAAAEARERANSEAREKAATASKTDAEARCRAERAAVERAAAEARERAAAEARERAAAARMNQQKNDNDLESFFSMGSRPSSAPRPRANTSDSVLDPQVQSKGGPEGTRRTSVSTSSNMRKASSTTNIVDDLTSIFGVLLLPKAVPSSGAFQEVEGETEERRRARLERHQRTQERAAKALAEKNQRDVQTLREQEERHGNNIVHHPPPPSYAYSNFARTPSLSLSLCRPPALTPLHFVRLPITADTIIDKMGSGPNAKGIQVKHCWGVHGLSLWGAAKYGVLASTRGGGGCHSDCGSQGVVFGGESGGTGEEGDRAIVSIGVGIANVEGLSLDWWLSEALCARESNQSRKWSFWVQVLGLPFYLRGEQGCSGENHHLMWLLEVYVAKLVKGRTSSGELWHVGAAKSARYGNPKGMGRGPNNLRHHARLVLLWVVTGNFNREIGPVSRGPKNGGYRRPIGLTTPVAQVFNNLLLAVDPNQVGWISTSSLIEGGKKDVPLTSELDREAEIGVSRYVSEDDDASDQDDLSGTEAPSEEAVSDSGSLMKVRGSNEGGWYFSSGATARADVMCLQETKMEELDGDVVREVWGGRFVEWAYLPVVGTTGGVLLCWDKRMVVKEDEELGAGGCCASMVRAVVCGGGDFNMVRWPVERMSSSRVKGSMRAFCSFIDEMNLLLGEHFSEVVQSHFPRLVSYHWPIMLDSGGFWSGSTPFQFENMWLQLEGLLDKDLKMWNKEVFGQVEAQKAEVVAILQSLDMQEISGGAFRSGCG
ncbi:hypothetical protein CsSME_00041362 [Camellia sinensis var. sinensis]